MKRKIFLIIFGFVIALFISELFLRLSGHFYYQKWMKKESKLLVMEGNVDRNFNKLLSKHKVLSRDIKLCKILCVGDSLTFGFGASPGYSYPAQLQRILNKENPREYKVYNCGIPGCTSTKLLKYLPQVMEKYRPDIIVSLIGGNDRHNPSVSELPLLFNVPKRYYHQFKNVIMDLRVCKVIRFGLDGLKRRIRVSKKQSPTIKKNINIESIRYVNIGNEFRNTGKHETARNYYEKAINIDPNNEYAYQELAALYWYQLRKVEQSLLICKKLLKLNPYTSFRENVYQLLFLMYQQDDVPKDKIKAVIKTIPSGGAFKNPGMPFILNQKRINGNLKHNLEKMVALIKFKGAIPIFQTYPKGEITDPVIKSFSEKYDIPLINNKKTFEKLLNIEDYFNERGPHPNKKGYYLMAENVLKAIRPIERNE